MSVKHWSSASSATARAVGLVPERRLGIVILSNRGDIHPYDAARGTILPDLAKL